MPKKVSKIIDSIVDDVFDDSNFISNITIKGAKEHNLKNVDILIPRDKITVITGLSGSGKSSLAFDTIYAEGQRRYVECLSSYARQFLGMMKKPNVDSIEGLSPAISIEQKTLGMSPRSTVGTVTEIYDYLRLLYAKIGIQYCINCDIPVQQKSLDQIVDEILSELKNKKIQILAQVVKGRKGHYRELFEQLTKQGFTKVRIDGDIVEIEPKMQLSRFKIHDIEIVIDRLKVEESAEKRIVDSLQLAFKLGEGSIVVLFEETEEKSKVSYWNEQLYSLSYTCPKCSRSYEQAAPNMFSFNSPYGACSDCDGLGEIYGIKQELLFPELDKSILDSDVPFLDDNKFNFKKQIEAYFKAIKLDINTPVQNYSSEQLTNILFGDAVQSINLEYKFSGNNKADYKQKFNGIIPTLMQIFSKLANSAEKRNIEKVMVASPCKTCNGGRLKKENLYIRVGKYSIQNIVELSVDECFETVLELPSDLNKRQNLLSNQIFKEIITRLEFLKDVGLNYLTLARTSRTLSGGEAQRIRLASQIGSKLVGVTYVLDEPSIGLHQHDNYKLINSLKNLRDLGNTLVIVEHDKAMIEEADLFVDLGPGAGIHGGNLMLEVDPKELFAKNKSEAVKNSITAKYLRGDIRIEYNKERRAGNGKFLSLKNATGNNLQNIDLNLPLGKMICISGMSGSGKSSLINDTLVPILQNYFNRSQHTPLPYSKIEGLEHLDKIIEIDQSPIGRSPRSNPSTYTGIFTHIREFFALLPESQIRGYKIGRFSFNVKDGRCPECNGDGIKKIEMNLLPDVYVVCDTCDGKRYNKETLQVHYKGKSISDVLEMSVEESLTFFNEIPRIKEKIQTLFDVGLSYIKLGQQAPTLSGGEAQRVKLATELSKRSTGKTIYLLDEPTTGLHFEDIRILMNLLNKLVDLGNTVVIIEHNLDVIKCADWIVDLGPMGGKGGGKIIAEGTPEQIIKSKVSLTAKYLKDELK